VLPSTEALPHGVSVFCAASAARQAQHFQAGLQLLDHLLTGELGSLKAPSISINGSILYMRGPLEVTYHKNLAKPLADLLDAMPDAESCAMVVVTDPTLPNPVKVRLVDGDVQMSVGADA
jgi:E2 binding domain